VLSVVLRCTPILLLLLFRVRVRVTLRLAVYSQSVRLGAKLLRTHGQNFFQSNTCGRSPYVTSSLTRGWVCRLKLLLAFASAFILSSESLRTHDHILLSQIRDAPTWRERERERNKWVVIVRDTTFGKGSRKLYLRFGRFPGSARLSFLYE
jgi:hypothetical protein